jgi:hypothetical protein
LLYRLTLVDYLYRAENTTGLKSDTEASGSRKRAVAEYSEVDTRRIVRSANGPQKGRSAVERKPVGSVIKKRRKRMAKKKHRKLLKKTRVQRRKLGK